MKDLVSLILPKLKVNDSDILKEEYKKMLEQGHLYGRKCDIFQTLQEEIRAGKYRADFAYARFCFYSIYRKSQHGENPMKKDEVLFHEDEESWYVIKKYEIPIIEYLTKELDLKFVSAVPYHEVFMGDAELRLFLSWDHWKDE